MKQCTREPGGPGLFVLATALALAAVQCSPVLVDQPDESSYQQAYQLYDSGQYPSAIAAFSAFIGDYPYSSRLDNAEYYLGRSYMRAATTDVMVDYSTKAVASFDDIDQRSNQYVPGQFYRAVCYDSIHHADSAVASVGDVRRAYGSVIDRFGSTDWARKARAALARL